MRFSDVMLGVMLLAFGAVLAGFATTFPAIPGQRYGAEAFPFLIAIGFVGCGIALVLRGIRRKSGEALIARSDWAHRRGAIPAVLLTIGLVTAYVVVSGQVGFVPAMAALLFVLFRLLRVPWAHTAGLALVGTLLLDVLFRGVLLVPLPLGIVPRLPW